MALKIEFEDNGEYVWRVGQTMTVKGKEVLEVLSVSADGGELIKIFSEIKNMPMVSPPPKVCRWFGDHARFIVANLNY